VVKVPERQAAATRVPQAATYREAVDLTTRTVAVRARAYRNLVVVVVGAVVLPMLAALIMWSWRPLAGPLVLVPLCAAFVSFDTWLVSRWRQRILWLWASGNLDLVTFGEMATSVRALPTPTLKAMLSSLPPFTVPLPGQATAPVAMRESLVTMAGGIDAQQSYRMIATAVAVTATVAAVAAGVVAGSWDLMLSVALAPLVVVAGRTVARRTLRRSVPERVKVQEAGLDPKALAAAAALLDWRHVSNAERDGLLARLERDPGDR